MPVQISLPVVDKGYGDIDFSENIYLYVTKRIDH
jgi:hypothetical protein